jgi:uncharacterized protein
MRRLLRYVAYASVPLTLACSNGQASSVPATRNAAASASAATPALTLEGPITDAAHILSAEQQSALNWKLQRLEERTKHQLVVVTVPTLGGRDVADFTRDLANSWGIGAQRL